MTEFPAALAKIFRQTSLSPDRRAFLLTILSTASKTPGMREAMLEPGKLPETTDPVLLAFRTLALRDFSQLRAIHRWAAETATTRPFGPVYLVLEEAVRLGAASSAPAAPEDDEALKIVFDLLPTRSAAEGFEKEHFDLRARYFAEVARRQIRRRDPSYGVFLPLAHWLRERGTGDVELEVFLEETLALSLAAEGDSTRATDLRIEQIQTLIEKRTIPGRAAEATADLADFVTSTALPELKAKSTAAAGPGRKKVSYHRARADLERLAQYVDLLWASVDKQLSELPADFNLPLRRRLAARRAK